MPCESPPPHSSATTTPASLSPSPLQPQAQAVLGQEEPAQEPERHAAAQPTHAVLPAQPAAAGGEAEEGEAGSCRQEEGSSKIGKQLATLEDKVIGVVYKCETKK